MKIGLIGFGSMGKNHYRVLKGIEGVELVAVCDPISADGLPERCYRSCTTMLSREHLDAVVVAVPTSSHYETALEVIRYNVPLLLEKPLAATVAEGQRLIRAADKAGVLSAVGHVERFNPVVRALIRELRDKEIYSIAITRVGPFPPRINDVGVLVDLSVHDIDLVHCLTNNRRSIEERIYKSNKQLDGREDNAIIAFHLEGDVVASIVTNWLTPFKRRTIEVATDRAFYTADLVTQELVEYSAYEENGSHLVRQCSVDKGEPLKKELEAFLHYVKTGERDGLATLEDGLRPLQCISRERVVDQKRAVEKPVVMAL